MDDPYIKYITLEKEDLRFNSLAEAFEFIKINPDKGPIKQILSKEIFFKKPKYLNNKKVNKTSEIDYKLKDLGKHKILQAIYPMDISDMKPMDKIDSIVIHHTGNGSSYSIPKVMDVQTGYTDWASIVYHYVIDKDGCIIATRPLEYEGGSVRGENAGKISLAFSINLDKHKLNEKVLDSYKILLEELSTKFKIEKVMGHFQLYLNKLNRFTRDLKKEIPDLEELAERTFLSARSLNEVRDLKRKAINKVYGLKKQNPKFESKLNKLIEKISFIKSCPGINFYPYLK